MNIKDRRIHLLLQIFFLIVGFYQFIRLFGTMHSGQFSGNLFEFQNNNLPVLLITASFVTGGASLVSSFALWIRTTWAYGFTLFTSGLLFSYHLLNLGVAIHKNSHEIIPIVLVLMVILQSFPFLLRRSYRSA